jgi:hypothetical protein
VHLDREGKKIIMFSKFREEKCMVWFRKIADNTLRAFTVADS